MNTILVAGTDASQAVKRIADYICDGVDDHIEIRAALDALDPTEGGTLLLVGTIDISKAGTTLNGYGRVQIVSLHEGTS